MSELLVQKGELHSHGSVGVFLTAPKPGYPCARLPVGVDRWTPDPWTWFSPSAHTGLSKPCRLEPARSDKRGPQLSVECRVCPAGHGIARMLHGLVWSGLEREVELDKWKQQGVSIFVPYFPIGIEFGRTVCFVARRMKLGTFEYAITDSVVITGVDLIVESESMRDLVRRMAEKIGPEARVVP